MDVTDKLQNAPLERVPQQEIEVVFLFSQIFKKYGFTKIKQMQLQFPDCIAYRKTNSGLKEVRIEFEYQSINFDHDPKKCDCIVCWEDNWLDKPKNLEVIELRKHYGFSPKIWVMAVGNNYKGELSEFKVVDWTVPSKCHVGDLVLFYYNAPDSCIKNIFVIKGQKSKKKWKRNKKDEKKKEYVFADIKHISGIRSPLSLDEMKKDKILSTSRMLKMNMMGHFDVTENWWHLYDLIIKKNPSLKRDLSKFSPEKIFR